MTTGPARKNVMMRRLILPGVIALAVSAVFTGSASAATGPNFDFKYANSYGSHGLSQPYTGATGTGASYGTGVAIQVSDTSGKVYSLVEANPNVGVGGCRGCFPATGRTISASSTIPDYLGPYCIVRRTSSGRIDTSFGDNGYSSVFTNSADSDFSSPISASTRHQKYRRGGPGNHFHRTRRSGRTSDPTGRRFRHRNPGHEF
ncbi:MAG TPA: hypothetical protein VFG87_08290 [Amycolatopsis sp.]|nr:hypothetical protein [Amycolatopsis sp.]